jgi:hypothetical protein
MATRIYAINRGETFKDITEGVGSATASKSIELTYDLAANLTREDVFEALELFEQYILQNKFPPA